jgi:hypothetical protein
MITSQEAYYADKQTYTTLMADLTAYGYTQSTNVAPAIGLGTTFTYTMTTRHASGDHTYTITGPGGAIQ